MIIASRSTRRTRLPAMAGSLVLLAALTGGCAAAEDAVGDAVDQAACSLARDTLDGVESQVRDLADQLGANPQAARRELTTLREALAAAEGSLSGETRERIAQAREAVDRLVTESREAAQGAVDEQAVAQAREQLDEAVTGLADVC